MDLFKAAASGDVEEQQAIANVAHVFQREIAIESKRLNLFKQQKKGLMQQLLTGKTRVKVAEAVV